MSVKGEGEGGTPYSLNVRFYWKVKNGLAFSEFSCFLKLMFLYMKKAYILLICQLRHGGIRGTRGDLRLLLRM